MLKIKYLGTAFCPEIVSYDYGGQNRRAEFGKFIPFIPPGPEESALFTIVSLIYCKGELSSLDRTLPLLIESELQLWLRLHPFHHLTLRNMV